MEPLNGFDRDEPDYAAADFPPPRPVPPVWSTLPAGLLAVAGAVSVGIGIFQRYFAAGGLTLRDSTGVPDWRLHLGLAAAVGLAGLATLAGHTVLARTGAGAIVVPALLLAALEAGIAVPTLTGLVRARGVGGIGLGAWLTAAGAAAGLVAALLALAGAVGLADSGRGGLPPVLAGLGVTGLLYSWVDSATGAAGGRGVPGYLGTFAGADTTGAAVLAVVAGLGFAATAIGLATARRAAAAAGVALGAAVAVGVDLGVRLFMVRGLPAGTPGGQQRAVSLITLGATVLLLLLLALLLRGRPWPDEDDMVPAEHPTGFEPAGFDAPGYGPASGGYGGTRYGAGGEYEPDPADRPYQTGAFEPPRYLAEHDPTPGARYPLLPDERAARHPSPPRPGISPEG